MWMILIRDFLNPLLMKPCKQLEYSSRERWRRRLRINLVLGYPEFSMRHTLQTNQNTPVKITGIRGRRMQWERCLLLHTGC